MMTEECRYKILQVNSIINKLNSFKFNLCLVLPISKYTNLLRKPLFILLISLPSYVQFVEL